jgi:hypothetical protein
MAKKRRPFRVWGPGGIPAVTEEEALRNPNPDHVRLVIPKGSDAEKIYQDAVEGRLCGVCRHFRLKEGQAMFRDEQTFLEIFDKLSIGHNVDWYGGVENLGSAGICGYWGPQHMVFFKSPSRINRLYVDSDVDYSNKDEPVRCPHWEHRDKGQRSTPHYVGKRRNYEE